MRFTEALRRLSPATVIAVLALVLALGGTAVAAGYVITNIHQIKPSVRKQLRGHRGMRGPQGAPGPKGAAGPAGPQGPSGPANVVLRWSPPVNDPHAGAIVVDAYARCHAGEHLVGGGGNVEGNAPGVWQTHLIDSNPSDGTVQGVPPDGSQTLASATTGIWHVKATNDSGAAGNDVTLHAYALCAS